MRYDRSVPSRSPTCRSRRGASCRRLIASSPFSREDCGSGTGLLGRSCKSMGRNARMNIKVGRQAISEATEKLKNWGRWGNDDQIGTLNHVRPEDIVKAAGLIRSGKAFVLGIEHSRNKMIGRGVLLDIARFRDVDWLADGEGISNDELDQCAKKQKVEIGRGDFVIVRTGQMERCLEEKKWGGYAGGDAP